MQSSSATRERLLALLSRLTGLLNLALAAIGLYGVVPPAKAPGLPPPDSPRAPRSPCSSDASPRPILLYGLKPDDALTATLAYAVLALTTAQGWQALGVIHHDMNHRGLDLSQTEKSNIYDVIAALDWSGANKAWVDIAGLGQWAVPKNGTTEQVVILGAGRNNTQAIIDYLRTTTGLQAKLDALAAPQSELATV